VPFLFDTDTLSAMIGSRPNPYLTRRLARLPDDEQFTSAINYGELLYGALRRYRPDRIGAIRDLMQGLPILPFDERAAELFAGLRTDLESAGMRLDDADLRIAAIALSYDLTLVTGNERHFRRVPGLRVENWLAV
jgi:tRNA(fMet)-specific endonuclease VapC